MGLSKDWITRREAVVAAGVPRATEATVSSARGAILIDADGREIIDFAGGIGVMNVGHSAPAVVDAIAAQSQKLQHTCIHIATYEPYIELCERLTELFPHGNRTKAMLVNSGAEAVENAIKIARQSTGRGSILCYTHAFHGRTLLCATLTSKVGYKKGCGPFAPGVHRLPFPNYFLHNDGLDEDAFVARELDRLRRVFVNTVDAEEVAAIIIEVVQGEGGFVVAPRAYLHGLRDICDEFGIVLIFDEVQSGFCRTGAWAAYQHFDVTPDISTWAKSMGGGLPISAVVGRAEVMDGAKPGTLGGTYGGNPVACAAALATIQSMKDLDLNARATSIGNTVRTRFEAWAQSTPEIVDVRGLGAMMAIEFAMEGNPARPAGALVKEIAAGCLADGLLIIAAGAYGNVIRILSPLVITDDELSRGLDILESRIAQHTGRSRADHLVH